MREKTLTGLLGETISDSFNISVTNYTNAEFPVKKTILQRIASADTSAVSECVEFYGNYVWSLAKRCCKNNDETEEIVQKIFLDIWKTAENFDAHKTDEKTFIAVLSLRQLLKNKEKIQ